MAMFVANSAFKRPRATIANSSPLHGLEQALGHAVSTSSPVRARAHRSPV
jgi:hypothetical protein